MPLNYSDKQPPPTNQDEEEEEDDDVFLPNGSENVSIAVWGDHTDVHYYKIDRT